MEESKAIMSNIEETIKGLEEFRDTLHEMNDRYEEQLISDALNIIKEYRHEKERNPVIVCPYCGRRVK